MTIELMRRLDYCLGIPLCFVLMIIHSFSRLRLFVFREDKDRTPQKILFIKLSEMGGVILSYPLIKRIEEEYPQAKRFFLTFDKNKPVFKVKVLDVVHNILTIREDSICLFILDTLRVIKKLRKENIDVVFDLELFSRFTAMLTYLTKATKRIGFYQYSFEGLYRGNLLTHKVQYNSLIHISKAFLSLSQVIKAEKKISPELKKIISDNEIALPGFIPSEKDRERALNRLRSLGMSKGVRLFLINPGEGTIPLREWPLENFIALSKDILKDSRNYIIVVGNVDLSNKAKRFCETLDGNRCINLNGKTTLSELLTLFNIAEALISYDCGLAHIASLTSIKKFVIFGPDTPQVHSPLGVNTYIIYSNFPCSPCFSAFNHRKSACRNNKCLKAIKPDEVYEILKPVLSVGDKK